MIRRKPKKLEHLSSLWVDPARRLRFRFGLGWYQAYVGDTIATAMYRNGITALSRSSRFRRPRGMVDLSGDVTFQGVNVDGMPDRPAETTPVREGMVVHPQGPRRPRPWEPGGILARLLPNSTGLHALPWPLKNLGFLRAGYHQTTAAIAAIDPAFRMTVPMSIRYLHCDVCVVGGGAAGMTAALAAADQGLRVILLERQPRLGGGFAWQGREFASGVPRYQRAANLAHQLSEHPDVRLFLATEVTQLFPGGRVLATRRGGRGELFFEERLEIRAQGGVLATGRRERLAVFENNDRPGILTADTALGLARLYGILPGRTAVVAVADDAGLATALELAELGVTLAAVADRRTEGDGPRYREALEDQGIPLLDEWFPFAATGRKRLNGVTLRPVAGGEERRFAADFLIASAGREPVAELAVAAGATLGWQKKTGQWELETWPEGLHPAGELLGIQEASAVELSGWCAGLAAAADAGVDVGEELRRYRSMEKMAPRVGPAGDGALGWSDPGRWRFLTREPEITLEDVAQAVRAGFEHPETAAAYLRNGVGIGPGAPDGETFRRALAWFRGVSPADVPPMASPAWETPMLAGTLAAGRRDPIRRTPMVERAVAFGVLAARIGDWSIPGRYGADPMASDELAAVRAAVGLMDASATGKFRVFGPGALPALHRIYVNNLARLKTGDAVPSVLCHPDGYPLDIGELARHDQDDFFLTTRPERVDDFEDWIRRNAPPDTPAFHVVDLTDAMGTLVLAGAAAGEVLQRVTRYNVSAAALPPMGYRWLKLEEVIPARVIRTDALAEPCYAIHVPASRTAAAWDLLSNAGAYLGIRPFGTVAAVTLRLRRGGIDLARETDARTTLVDVGLGKLWGLERSAPRPLGEEAWRGTMGQQGRIKRAFFRGAVNDPLPPDGAVILVGDRPVGHVCLCRFVPEIRAAMGTALIPDHLAIPETRLHVAISGDPDEEPVEVEIRELDQMRWPLHRALEGG